MSIATEELVRTTLPVEVVVPGSSFEDISSGTPQQAVVAELHQSTGHCRRIRSGDQSPSPPAKDVISGVPLGEVVIGTSVEQVVATAAEHAVATFAPPVTSGHFRTGR